MRTHANFALTAIAIVVSTMAGVEVITVLAVSLSVLAVRRHWASTRGISGVCDSVAEE